MAAVSLKDRCPECSAPVRASAAYWVATAGDQAPQWTIRCTQCDWANETGDE